MGASEEPLRQRICRGAGCGAVFWICRHCDRGHRYCGERCRRKARRQQLRTAIEHLRGRDRKLEPLGWTGPDAEWIALVCLHSGVFTRAQFCHYFNADRKRALRFVKGLLDRRAAAESEWPIMNGGGKTCRISSNVVYRALGVENIRHRRKASKPVVIRRLLSLDFILEHPGMNWLPTEPEKVECFEKLGLPRRLIPRRIYYGVVGNQKRYFALKLPLAVDPETATFAYVDPGHRTDTELCSWGAAHGPLWNALRTKGRQVRVIGVAVENANVDRAARLLEAWAAADPGTPDQGLTVRQEIKAIHAAMKAEDDEFLARYGGFAEAGRRSVELQRLPEAKVTEGVSLDDYSTWRATRFSEPV